MKQRILLKLLRELGYSEWRHDGKHIMYGEPGGHSVDVPDHREIKEGTAARILNNARDRR